MVLPSQTDTWPAWQQAEMKSRHIFLQETTKKNLLDGGCSQIKISGWQLLD